MPKVPSVVNGSVLKPSNKKEDLPKTSGNLNDTDELVKFDCMGFENPYPNIYGEVLQKNVADKESALRNFKINEVVNEIKLSTETKEEKPRKSSEKSPGTTSNRSSPYAIRERKKKINYGETDIGRIKTVTSSTVPLRRLSQRLIKKPAAINESSAAEETFQGDDSKKLRRGLIKMNEVVMEEVEEEKWMEDMRKLGKYLVEHSKGKERPKPMEKSWKMDIDCYKTAKRYWSYPVKEYENLDKFKGKVSKLRMWCGTMARVIKERVSSIAVHPSKECLLITVGGKVGVLGIWSVFPEKTDSKEDMRKESALDQPTGIYRFQPHDEAINCTSFCRYNGDSIITSSYDGTVRRLNLEKLVFDQLYGSPDGMGHYWMQWHCQLSPNIILASQGTGNVYILDDRSQREYEDVLECYERSCRTLDIHPLYPNYLATSSSVGYASIWDLRKFKKVNKKNNSGSGTHGLINSDAAICHLGGEKRRLYSAFFSPVTGSGLLTASSDDYIRIYDTSKLVQASSSSTFRVETSIKYNTGRWLLTFKAVWHPQRDDAFVIGSMEQPREVNVFGRHGRLLASIGKDGPLPINTICPVNAFHPNRLVLASADSAGRVHVFL